MPDGSNPAPSYCLLVCGAKVAEAAPLLLTVVESVPVEPLWVLSPRNYAERSKRPAAAGVKVRTAVLPEMVPLPSKAAPL